MPKQEVKIFREKYKQYKFTVNDMLIIMIARLIKKYHRLSDANKQVVLNLIDSLLAAQD